MPSDIHEAANTTKEGWIAWFCPLKLYRHYSGCRIWSGLLYRNYIKLYVSFCAARPGFVAYLFVVQYTTAVLYRCFYIRFVLPLIQRSFGSLHPPVSDRTFNPRWIASRKSPLFNTLVLSDFDLFVSVSAAIRSVETGWNGLVKQKRRHPRILPTKNGYFTDWIDFHIFARNEYRFVRTVKKQNTRNLLCSRHILSLPEEVRKDNPNPAGHQSPGTGVSP